MIVVIPVAYIYGFNPSSQFDIYLGTTDEQNFFKATMGLYLGFSVLWILGVFKAQYLKLALVSNIVFMFGLGLGRVVSICVDGKPSMIYILGTMGELLLGFYGVWVLKQLYISK